MRHLTVTGYITQDSEIVTLPSGAKFLKLNLCSKEYDDEKNEDGTVKPTWINCTTFNDGLFNMQKYFKKGVLIIANGDLKTRLYQKKDGSYAIAHDLKNCMFHFIESSTKKNDGGDDPSVMNITLKPVEELPIATTTGHTASTAPVENHKEAVDDLDDLPF